MNKSILVILLLLAVASAHAAVSDITSTSAIITSSSETAVTFYAKAGTTPDDLYIVASGGTGTSTSITLNELQPETTYHYIVEHCTDACIIAETGEFLTSPAAAAGPGADMELTYQNGTLSAYAWSDTEAQFTFYIGTDPQELTTPIDGGYGLESEILLEGFEEGVRYYILAEVCTAECTDVIMDFMLPAPVIDAQITALTNESVTILATSDQEGVFSLYYGTDPEADPTIVEGGLSTSSSMTASELMPETFYHYVVEVCTDDWCSWTDAGNFTTLATVIESVNTTNTTNTTNSTNSTTEVIETPQPRRSGGGGGGGRYIPPKTNVTANITNVTNVTSNDVVTVVSVDATTEPVADTVEEPETPLELAPAIAEDSILTAADNGLTGMVVAQDAPAQEPVFVLWVKSVLGTIAGWFG